MIFPESLNLRDLKQLEDETVKRSFLFDFKEKKFVVDDGVVHETEPIEAIQNWLELLIRTQLDKYRVYEGTGFGNSIENHIGHRLLPVGFIESEFERELKEAATRLNPAIAALRNFKITRLTRGLDVEFTVVLKDKSILEVKLSGI